MKYRILILLACWFGVAPMATAATYQSAEDFLQEIFAGRPPQPAIVWLKGDIQDQVSDILGHRYPSLRVRYWSQAGRSAWILEETGKDLPITTGIVIQDGKLELLRILIFRESRGWEVRHPFFTDQFRQATLSGNDNKLDRNIDNISGATLSVRAIHKLARMALYLDRQIRQQNDAP